MITSNFIQKLIKYNIILFNKDNPFTLKSGTESCIYIDFRRAISFPEIQKDLCDMYCNEITKPFATMPDYIVGVPDGAVPMAAQISAKLSIPLLMVRKQPKQHGTGKVIEGSYIKGSTVLIIEDIVTTGGSCMNIVNKLREEGLKPINILCLLKRSSIPLGMMHGMEIENGIVPLKSLLWYRDIEFQVKLTASKLCVAVDVDTMGELMMVIEKVHKYASIIKVHIDMIKDFIPSGDHNSVDQLCYIKNKYGVLLWEDRKFADIASVTYKQIINGVHQISKWADIVSVHAIAGPSVFQTLGRRDYLGGCKIFVIGQMSSMGTFADKEYLEKVLNMVDPVREKLITSVSTVLSSLDDQKSHDQKSHDQKSHDQNIFPDTNYTISSNVIGIVTQTDIKTNLLKIVPGIRHDADTINTDGSGQCYRKPSDVPWADIIVAGRGILNHLDKQNNESYKKQGSEISKVSFESIMRQYIF